MRPFISLPTTLSLLASAVVASAVVSTRADAQQLEQLPAAARVKVWTPTSPDSRLRSGVAALGYVGNNSIEVTLAPGESVRVARAQLTRVDVSEGMRTQRQGAAHGARWGALVGGLGGMIIGASAGGGGSGPGSCSDCSLVFAAGGAAGGAITGALVGGIIGSHHRGERWRTVLYAPHAR